MLFTGPPSPPLGRSFILCRLFHFFFVGRRPANLHLRAPRALANSRGSETPIQKKATDTGARTDAHTDRQLGAAAAGSIRGRGLGNPQSFATPTVLVAR